MHRLTTHMLLMLMGVAVPVSAFGQRYPSKPIRVNTPFITEMAVDEVAVGAMIGPPVLRW